MGANKSSPFAHFALGPGNRPASQDVDTVVSLAGQGAVVLFALSSCKLTACAALAAAEAYFLSRLPPQATLWEAGAGRLRRVD